MFSLVFNEGGAMGTRLGPSTYYLAMALVVLPLLLFYVYRNRSRTIVTIPLSAIAGGAIGNLIDRIRLGRVVDFLDFDIPDIDVAGFHLERFWTLNIADSAITCGIAFLLFLILVRRPTLDPVPEKSPEPGDRETSTGDPKTQQ